MNIRNFKTAKERRMAIEIDQKVDLSAIGSFSLDESVASTRNCENMIGAVQIPVGIAGPLKIKSTNNERITISEFFIPLATTEGALVASVNRGCKAITESGGAIVDSHRVGATRGPVFRVEHLSERRKLQQFLKDHFSELQSVAQKTSHHLTLTNSTSRIVGRYCYVRFVFDTKDAMGMNMVTIASTSIYRYIEKEIGVRCIAVSGNYCVDKKPAWQNVINGRGISVNAEVVLTRSVLADILKTTAKSVYDVWLAKCMIGSAISGSMAFNAQFANVVAALFLATGQDIAHVVEGGLGITIAEVVGDDLYISVHIPDLMAGIVGGGTGLATQKEALSILGVDTSQKFAEIIGAAVLAGEISLLSSLEQGSLAGAHRRLGRGEAQ